MEIKKAGLEDYGIIYDLAVRTWNDTYASILSREQVDYMLNMMYSREAIAQQLQDTHTFLLLLQNNNYIGFASYEVNYRPGATKLHKLYVLPHTHGKGAGKMLIYAVEAAAKNNSNDKIVLNVNRYNPAVKFYLKSGYLNVGSEDINIGNGYLMEDFIMEKAL